MVGLKVIVEFNEIDLIYKHIKSNIRNKHKLYFFEKNYYSNCINLINRIKSGYIYNKVNIFLIHDPKRRIIMSECIEDKLYNHLISIKILSRLDKHLIDSNCATRIGKGTSYARGLLDKYLIKLKDEDFYILKFDITKYFYNISHKILLSKLKKYLSSSELLLISNMLNVTNSNYINENIKSLGFDYFYRVGYGLSIGNVCSQNLAVFYLNEIDHFIKEELCCKYYIRYMDDGIILSKDKDYLRYIYNIIKIKLKNEYELELNNKTKLYKSSEGFTFIGFRYYIKNNKVYRRVRNSTRRSIKKRINIINETNYINYLKYEKL